MRGKVILGDRMIPGGGTTLNGMEILGQGGPEEEVRVEARA